MWAHELTEPYPYVSTYAGATDTALLPAEHRLPALLVVDRHDQPYAVVPGAQLVGRLKPEDALEICRSRPGPTTGTSTRCRRNSSGSRPRSGTGWQAP